MTKVEVSQDCPNCCALYAINATLHEHNQWTKLVECFSCKSLTVVTLTDLPNVLLMSEEEEQENDLSTS